MRKYHSYACFFEDLLHHRNPALYGKETLSLSHYLFNIDIKCSYLRVEKKERNILLVTCYSSPYVRCGHRGISNVMLKRQKYSDQFPQS